MSDAPHAEHRDQPSATGRRLLLGAVVVLVGVAAVALGGLLLLVSIPLLLGGAVLFTNAIEWLGRRPSLDEGAVGSVLAAVGTRCRRRSSP